MTADKVVDASALAAAAFLEPRASDVRALLHGHQMAAPEIIRFEMANICVKKIRDRPANRDTVLQQHAISLALPIGIYPVDQTQVVKLAERLNLSAYDASYLWLARQLGVDLVTLDQHLEKAAAQI